MRVERIDNRWVCVSTFNERHIPKNAGFRWDAEQRVWFTTDGAIAARLLSPQDARAAADLEAAKFKLKRDSILESVAADCDFFPPANPGLVYRPYQRAGILSMRNRPFTLNADDPGLGKTIQVAGLINCVEDLKKILVICPNSLRLNWLRELQKWLVRQYSIAVWNSEVCRPAYVSISIIHYDAATKWQTALRAVDWDLVVLDECHLLKNRATLRAKAILGIDKRTAKRLEEKRRLALDSYLPGARVPGHLLRPIEPTPPLRGRRAVGLTGTPLPNRPKEVFPILHYLDPLTFRSESKFKAQFCGAEWNGYGMDDGGASNLGELQTLLRSSVMIRRRKQDVLTELPPKQRTVIEIPHNAKSVVDDELAAYRATEANLKAMRAAAAEAKTKASERPDDYRDAVKKLKSGQVAAFSEISRQRHDTCMAKIQYVVDHLKSIVDGAGEKLIVFAHHHEMIDAIVKEFGDRATTCYGPDDIRARQAHVDRFQADPQCQIIAGSYPVMGVGWTLTASSHVVAAELDWVPGNMTQAEDRAHRMGQLNTVLVEHLVLEGSLEAYMAGVVVEKQDVQAQALDMEGDVLPTVATASPQAAPVAPPPARAQDSAEEPHRPPQPEPRPLPIRTYGQMSLDLLEGDPW